MIRCSIFITSYSCIYSASYDQLGDWVIVTMIEIQEGGEEDQPIDPIHLTVATLDFNWIQRLFVQIFAWLFRGCHVLGFNLDQGFDTFWDSFGILTAVLVARVDLCSLPFDYSLNSFRSRSHCWPFRSKLCHSWPLRMLERVFRRRSWMSAEALKRFIGFVRSIFPAEMNWRRSWIGGSAIFRLLLLFLAEFGTVEIALFITSPKMANRFPRASIPQNRRREGGARGGQLQKWGQLTAQGLKVIFCAHFPFALGWKIDFYFLFLCVDVPQKERTFFFLPSFSPPFWRVYIFFYWRLIIEI